MKKAIKAPGAPKAIGPYSQAILSEAKYRLDLAGQVGIDPSTGELAEGVKAQTEQALDNVQAVLGEIGWDFENLTKVRIYLDSMGDYPTVNETYKGMVGDEPPARAAVEVSRLPMSALVEIDCTAAGNTVSRNAREK